MNQSSKNRGFTMVELITVMVIVGILAAVAMPRFFQRNAFDDRGFHDQVISTLRYAQKAAIAQRRFVCVAFTGNGVNLTYGTNSSCTPSSGTLASPSGAALVSTQSTFTTTPTSFSFDCLGRPNSMAWAPAVTCGSALALTGQQTVQVTNADVITIEAETGYVH